MNELDFEVEGKVYTAKFSYPPYNPGSFFEPPSGGEIEELFIFDGDEELDELPLPYDMIVGMIEDRIEIERQIAKEYEAGI